MELHDASLANNMPTYELFALCASWRMQTLVR